MAEAPPGSDRTRSLRARLDALLRKPVPEQAAPARDGQPGARGTAAPLAGPPALAAEPAPDSGASSLAPLVYRRDLPRRQSSPGIQGPTGPATGQSATLSGVEVRHPLRGPALLVRTRVDTVPGGRLCSGALSALLRRADGPLFAWLAASSAAPDPAPSDLVFLDLETAGLGNAPLFLIGALVWAGGALEAQQYLARTYAEEAAAIALFLQDHQQRRVLVTFNGKSFDLPFLRMRAAANGLDCAWEPLHLDLLHAARRTWGGLLPDCRLQTLERWVCGRHRQGDIPGSLIPEVYHAYVRTQQDAQMVEVLRHNVLDLITLSELTVRCHGV
ncbi:MAG: ribonuclease H-like domain-containing protein [Candidatus Latescibacterota bacterium]